MFPRYLQYLLTDFRQTFVTDAYWDTDDLITFLGPKVKVQGHTIAAEAHSTRLFVFLSICLPAVMHSSKNYASKNKSNLLRCLDRLHKLFFAYQTSEISTSYRYSDIWLTSYRYRIEIEFLMSKLLYWMACFLALNGFAATAAAPASPVLNGHAALSQSHAATPAIYGTSAFFQLASPSATFPAVRISPGSVVPVIIHTYRRNNTEASKIYSFRLSVANKNIFVWSWVRAFSKLGRTKLHVKWKSCKNILAFGHML